MMTFLRFVSAGALFGTLMMTGPALATVVLPQSLQQMSEGAEVIVRAEVLTQRVVKERGRLVTETDFTVLESLKGDHAKGDVMTLGQLGGSLNGENLSILGTSRFAPGEEVFFFGMNYGDGRVISYGIGLGKFQVLRDDTGAEVVEEVGDVVAPSRSSNGRTQMSSVKARAYQSVPAFRAEIAGYVDAVGGRSTQKPLNRGVSKKGANPATFQRKKLEYNPPRHPKYSPRGAQ